METNLERIMRENDISILVLVYQTGIGKITIERYISGASIPIWNNAKKIAKYLASKGLLKTAEDFITLFDSSY